MLSVGHAAYARKDWPAAMTSYKAAAEAGNAEGAWELSLMHAHGKTGVVDKDEARKWLKIAAEGGAVKAQMFLAQMSTFGRGGYEKDEQVAFEYLVRASDQGNAHATHQLGVRYLYAVGVDQDLEAAIQHFERAVALGSTDAAKDLKIAREKKKGSLVRGIKKSFSKSTGLGRGAKKAKVHSSLRIKAASAPLRSPASSPSQTPLASPAASPIRPRVPVSKTVAVKRPSSSSPAPAAKRPHTQIASPPRTFQRANTWEPEVISRKPLRKFAYAYGGMVLLGVALAVGFEYF